MNKTSITRAMVLAAGLGLRLRPLTLERPKPLVEVGGRPLIDRTLDRLTKAGVTDAVVNLHYKSDMLRTHLAARVLPRLSYSDESDQLLETGGGVKKILPLFDQNAFYVVNSDILWLDARGDSLVDLRNVWDEEKMDALLLLHPTVNAQGYDGRGDFFMDPIGHLTRRDERITAPFLFTGVQILHPRLFKDSPQGAFSLNRLYDAAQLNGRLFGLRHSGAWIDCGSYDGLAAAERILRG